MFHSYSFHEFMVLFFYVLVFLEVLIFFVFVGVLVAGSVQERRRKHKGIPTHGERSVPP